MDQHLNNRQSEILGKLLANPAETGAIYSYNLQTLVDEYPQSGFFRALLAHADKDNAKNLNSAAVAYSPKLLYKLINQPESFAAVRPEQFFQQPEEPASQAENVSAQDAAPEPIHEIATLEPTDIVADEPVVETISHEAPSETIVEEPLTETADLPVAEEKTAEAADAAVSEEQSAEASVPAGEVTPPLKALAIEQEEQPIPFHHEQTNEGEVQPEIADEQILLQEKLTDDTLTTLPDQNETQAETPVSEPEVKVLPEFIEDDVYDEIVGIDQIHVDPSHKNKEEIKPVEPGAEAPVQEDVVPEPVNEVNPPVEPKPVAEEPAQNKADSEKPIFEQDGASTPVEQPEIEAQSKSDETASVEKTEDQSYFVFDRSFGSRLEEKEADDEPQEAAPIPKLVKERFGQLASSTNKDDVAKYNDDKLPYSFVWWLNKTRREHAGTYQPYNTEKPAQQPKRQTGTDEVLQHLYNENIFHINSLEDLDKSTGSKTIEFDLNRKTDRIIERFIKQEPQIKPPNSERLDNENKASKSAEDQNVVVSETLARVYTDQMLYHKAIATYKKLMLKFPEKSRYFADQIQDLEKRTI